MAGVYTVSQINAYIKNLFVRDYALSNICVKGEVSNCKYHTSGHIYFTLKDEGGAIACVMFARDRQGLGFRLSDGQQVVTNHLSIPPLATNVGSGDLLSSILAAYLATGAPPLAAAALAARVVTLAGSRAAAGTSGLGSWQAAFLDHLSLMTSSSFSKG